MCIRDRQYIDEKTLVIFVSQSGETADTLAALKLAKEHNCMILAITNVVGSTLAREAKNVFYTFAGPEIAVASTKAYTTQIISLYIIATYFANIKTDYTELYDAISKVLEKEEEIKEIAKTLINTKSIFYLGRAMDYTLAKEGALKLKEISYIHAEAFAAGELKHGTIALIEKDTPVISIMTQSYLYDKMLSNIQEVKARGAKVITISNKEGVEQYSDYVINIPKILSLIHISEPTRPY